MIAVIDYGMGNLRSVQKALESVGADVIVTDQPQSVIQADKVVLPGVGAIQPAMQKLKDLHLVDAIQTVVQNQKPFLGICLGYQLMFESSSEGGNIPGLGLLEGDVVRFKTSLKVPQMGWNQIHIQQKDCPLFQDVEDGAYVYFCHSYYVRPERSCVATSTHYDNEFASSIWKDNIYGVQFHPEKSQNIGLTLLKNFHAL